MAPPRDRIRVSDPHGVYGVTSDLCLEVGSEPAQALRLLGGLEMLGRVIGERDGHAERGPGRPGQLGLGRRVEAAPPEWKAWLVEHPAPKVPASVRRRTRAPSQFPPLPVPTRVPRSAGGGVRAQRVRFYHLLERALTVAPTSARALVGGTRAAATAAMRSSPSRAERATP